ncbi:MAG: hypothetical protein ACC682_08015 [Gemmatimonadota bacterium]
MSSLSSIRNDVPRSPIRRASLVWVVALGLPAALAAGLPSTVAAQDGVAEASVTFHADIVPILQQSCQRCHHGGGIGPMSLVDYETVRRYGRRIRTRTGIRDRAGAMPPWYVEKDLGIQHYKDDLSLDDAEIEAIASWVANGMPEGDPDDAPPPREFSDDGNWQAGEPDLVVRLPDVFVEGTAADWWGDIESTATGLTEDRYVKSVEVREVNDIDYQSDEGRETVGGRYVVHHMIWSTRLLEEDQDTGPGADRENTDVSWPVHEVGRNPDIFDVNGGRLLRAGSSVVSNSVHLHSNGSDTHAHLEIGFRFHPKDYEPSYKAVFIGLGNAMDIDIRADESDQELHAYTVLREHTMLVTFEPHLHAPGMRMCLEAIWGWNVETISCVGYDHNWVRGYTFAEDYQPLLPKGTVLHIIGYMDNSKANRNVPDSRNWQGSGNRSVANMFIDLGMRLELTEEQFVAEMAQRRERLGLDQNDHVIGCPLCMVIPEEVVETEADGEGDDGEDGR